MIKFQIEINIQELFLNKNLINYTHYIEIINIKFKLINLVI